MFNFLNKAKNEVSAITTPVPKILTLPEVVKNYVSTNKDSINDDFTKMNSEIAKNEKIIDFLLKEERKGYDNEKTIYKDKRLDIQAKNERLEKQKIEMTQQIEANKIGYQKIDLSFLSMKRPIEDKRLIFHPVFSAHKYNGSGFIECSIKINRHGISMDNNNFVLSLAVMKNLFEVFIPDIDKKEEKIYTMYESINYRSHDDTREEVELRTYFKGIIPATTKEKIKKAEKTFSDKHHGIFLIKECPSWEELEITKDPLIIGVIGDQTYFIDHFDCTDLETYVKAEFVE